MTRSTSGEICCVSEAAVSGAQALTIISVLRGLDSSVWTKNAEGMSDWEKKSETCLLCVNEGDVKLTLINVERRDEVELGLITHAQYWWCGGAAGNTAMQIKQTCFLLFISRLSCSDVYRWVVPGRFSYVSWKYFWPLCFCFKLFSISLIPGLVFCIVLNRKSLYQA